jgi:steroid 5-alpha reductase family enzyme
VDRAVTIRVASSVEWVNGRRFARETDDYRWRCLRTCWKAASRARFRIRFRGEMGVHGAPFQVVASPIQSPNRESPLSEEAWFRN